MGGASPRGLRRYRHRPSSADLFERDINGRLPAKNKGGIKNKFKVDGNGMGIASGTRVNIHCSSGKRQTGKWENLAIPPIKEGKRHYRHGKTRPTFTGEEGERLQDESYSSLNMGSLADQWLLTMFMKYRYQEGGDGKLAG